MTHHSAHATGIAWDLSDLYSALDDPAIERDIDLLRQRAEAFESRHRGTVSRLDSAALAAVVAEMEAILEGAGRLSTFADLSFCGDTTDAACGALMTHVRETGTLLRAKLIFFELEWVALDDEAAEAHLGHPELAGYRHYLDRERVYKPHRLSEGEEVLMDVKDNTGAQAFGRLFDESLARMRFTVRGPEGERELGEEEVLGQLYSPKRPVRKAAAEALTAGLETHGHLLTFIFNNLVADHAASDRTRRFDSPMAARNMANEISQDSVDALLSACDDAVGTVQDYYGLKRELLGLDTLYDYDRYAPMGEAGEIGWDEAREIVLASFGAFSPQMADIAQLFFDNRWIDAEARPGKRGGAFSHSAVPSAHPFVLLNYQGRPRDVMTLAHELGHGVHQYLARERGYLGCHTPLTTAETASVFGEMLVFAELKRRIDDPKALRSLLCGKLEDTFATVFRQVVMTRFEQALHQARRSRGELDSATIDGLWMDTNAAMFGDSLTLQPGYGVWWRYIPHFVHTPFYCYAYAYGELLVLSLYARYLEMGDAFVPRYLEMLAKGGSEDPAQMLAPLGVDINRPDFWQGGLEVIAGWVTDARRTATD